ncbi:MAG TPA: MFS transporter [Rhizomicrobium sp.]|nr:MFS transporter [Rhizomicrobium sp.]
MQDSDGLPTPQRYWAIVTIGLAITMAVMDSAIANVALPTIAQDLNTDAAASIWIINGYQLAIMISLLPLSALGEIVGYRRIYLGGLVLFTLSSLLCALSDSFAMLAFARVVQGFGAAGIMSVNGALVRFVYPQNQLGKGIGINAVIVSISAAAGPTLASAILAVGTWPWLFAINVPLGIITIAIALRTIPRTPHATHRFDYLSAALSAGTFGLLIAAVDALGHGASYTRFAIAIVATGLLGFWLVRRQLSRTTPLLPMDLLRIPIFTLSVCTSICSFMGQMLAFVALPFLLQGPLQFTAVQTGLLMTPWPIAVGFASPVAGWLADRYPAGLLGGGGLAVFSIGLLALALMPHDASMADVSWRMALCGAGFGFFQSPNNRTLLSAAPRARSGGASGMLGTARLLGQTIGAALVALMFSHFAEGGAVVALYVAAGVALAGAGVSVLRLSARGSASA